jgi:predicted ABC-type sugar transport system permease subunit
LPSAKRALKVVAGSLLVAAGVIGLLLPIVPGWALIIPGALLLGFDVAYLTGLLDRHEHRWPKLRPWFARLRNWLPRKQ